YNSPESGTDTLEFLEIYNNDTAAITLTGYNFTSGVSYTFPAMTMNPGQYIVLAHDTTAVNNFYTTSSLKFSGGLGNDGEALVLTDNYGRTVDSVYYDDNPDWPDADETGY
ncbi:MAG: lamin tail domain-containing protein, partial [Bacteroidetes bacterium]|nr:lamin tail domain-containing protein [Bacteroidota bacterium]